MTSIYRVVALWMEGYRIHQIAKLAKLSRRTITEHVTRGTLKLPERPWIGPTNHPFVPQRTIGVWGAKGLVRVSPGGLYHRDDIARVYYELVNRKCAKADCKAKVNDFSLHTYFCPEHRGKHLESPERMLAMIQKYPGATRNRLLAHSNLNSAASLDDALAPLLRAGLIEEVSGANNARRYYPIAREEAS